MRTLRCPTHATAMLPLFVTPSGGGTEIEIDRCVQCGAVWFDPGELEVLAGLHSGDATEDSRLPCPVCEQPMLHAQLTPNTVGQRCLTCHGTFVDGEAVKRLRGLALPPVAGKSAPKAAQVGFACARCSKRFPIAQGNATRIGLMCPECVVNPQVSALAASDLSGGNGKGAIDWDLFDVFDLIADFF